jgi:hypothetical protein
MKLWLIVSNSCKKMISYLSDRGDQLDLEEAFTGKGDIKETIMDSNHDRM